MATATAHYSATGNPYTGMVWINRPAASRPELPFGGTKRSGYGRARGAAGIEEFANHKLICAVAPDAPVAGFAG